MKNNNNLYSSPKEELKAMMFTLKILLPVIAVLFSAVFILDAIVEKKNPQSNELDYKYSAYAYSKELVRDKLKSPSSADFPIYDPSFVTKKGNTYTVIAYVDAKNSFGTKVRTNYVADITFTNDIPSGKAVIVE